MTGYLINFSIYTLAMVGIIFAALFIFKYASRAPFSKKAKMLNIEDAMSLSARKKLYIINVQGERFLIAADLERTSLISKLSEKTQTEQVNIENIPEIFREDKSTTLKSFDGIESMSEFASILEFNKKRSQSATKPPMMKELARKLSAI